MSARSIQKMFRGLQGRKRYKAFKALRELMRRHHAAMVIQRMYRGYCGRLLAAVASALRKLRAKHQYFALEMQRFVRGCIGRQHFKVHRELFITIIIITINIILITLPTHLPTHLQGASRAGHAETTSDQLCEDHPEGVQRAQGQGGEGDREGAAEPGLEGQATDPASQTPRR